MIFQNFYCDKQFCKTMVAFEVQYYPDEKMKVNMTATLKIVTLDLLPNISHPLESFLALYKPVAG